MDSERQLGTEPREPGASASEASRVPAGDSSRPAECLTRTEQTLVQIRDLLEIQARERQYQTASPLLVVGLVVQVAVVGLIALALLDWAFGNFAAPLYIKLMLAVVLQLIALTVFLVTRER